MNVTTVKIHNFRSVKQITFDLQNYSLLVGKNNSGKTNILDAIQCFFDSKYKFDEKRDFPKFPVDDEESWVEVTYSLSDAEYKRLASKYKTLSKLVTLRQYFKVKKGSNWNANKVYAYENGSLSKDEFYGFVQKSKIGKTVYIPAISKLSDSLKLTGPSPLRELMNEVVKPIIANSPDFSDFKLAFQALKENILNVENQKGQSLLNFEKNLNQELSSWDVELGIEFVAPSEDDIIKQSIKFNSIDKNLNSGIDPENYGSGFQRHLIYSLIKLSSEYANAENGDPEVFRPELTLILFEEPEAFLHPTQQLLLAESLRKFSAGENDNLQVLISTHSPHFVSYNIDDLKSIIHVSKNCQETVIGQLDEKTLLEIQSDNQEINEVCKGVKKYEADSESLQIEMENIKYALWLDPDRCGMFFAEHVCLVEGRSEYALLNYLLKNGKISDPKKSLFVVDCIGKFNIHRYLNLLGKLKIAHSIILDKDNEKDIHPQIYNLIIRSKNEYTRKIICFKENLEKFLRIPSSNGHKKPQHLMYQLTVLNNGDESQIQKLCNEINKLLTENISEEVVL